MKSSPFDYSAPASKDEGPARPVQRTRNICDALGSHICRSTGNVGVPEAGLGGPRQVPMNIDSKRADTAAPETATQR
jgi:hypothetical protein